MTRPSSYPRHAGRPPKEPARYPWDRSDLELECVVQFALRVPDGRHLNALLLEAYDRFSYQHALLEVTSQKHLSVRLLELGYQRWHTQRGRGFVFPIAAPPAGRPISRFVADFIQALEPGAWSRESIKIAWAEYARPVGAPAAMPGQLLELMLAAHGVRQAPDTTFVVRQLRVGL
jgi:hypothetical protein